MEVTGTEIGAALARVFTHQNAGHRIGWMRHIDGATAWCSGLPSASLNGVWAWGDAPDPADCSELLDSIEAEGVPLCMQLRPGASAELARVPAAHGMACDHEVPLMALSSAALQLPPVRPAMRVRVLEPSEAPAHWALAAAGFGGPIEVFKVTAPPSSFATNSNVGYLAEVAGSPVCTALTTALDDGFVFIFNVATPPAHRGQGYAAALTAHVTRCAFERGARYACLQSSPMGMGVYPRLGFKTVEAWSCWTTPSDDLLLTASGSFRASLR